MRKSPFRHLLLAGSILSATAAPALALDAEDMLTKLNAASVAQGGMIFTYDDVEEDGDGDITVSGVVYGPDAGSPDAPVEMQQVAPVTLSFEGVREDGNGGYTIDSISTFDLAFAADEFEIGIGSFTQGDIKVPASPETDMLSGMNYAGSTQASDITFTTKGHQVATIENAAADQTFENGDKASFLGTVSGIAIDLSGVEDISDETRATLTALNLMEMHAGVTVSGDWNMQSGDMNFSTYEIAIEDVGTLDIGFRVTGMTLETIETLQKLAEEGQKMKETGSAAEAEEPDPSQQYLLELGQKIGLSEFRISFTDDSITTRALQYAAEKEGMIAEEMADKIEVDLGASLSAMNVPDLADMVTTAVGTYFSDPQNISVSIKPQMQMPILAVVMAGAAAPQSIPKLLNLQITANE